MLGIHNVPYTKLVTWDSELTKPNKVSALMELRVMVGRQRRLAR